ncbi:MAG TPA: hypothetical protein VHC63_13415 [Acidimicrobiales bacterium]|nr:hypothetical protein [Acidimicrobiales bacterium]
MPEHAPTDVVLACGCAVRVKVLTDERDGGAHVAGIITAPCIDHRDVAQDIANIEEWLADS